MKKFSYDKAKMELIQIVENLESNNTPIDTLTKQVEKAKKLISACRSNLRDIEKQLEEE